MSLLAEYLASPNYAHAICGMHAELTSKMRRCAHKKSNMEELVASLTKRAEQQVDASEVSVGVVVSPVVGAPLHSSIPSNQEPEVVIFFLIDTCWVDCKQATFTATGISDAEHVLKALYKLRLPEEEQQPSIFHVAKKAQGEPAGAANPSDAPSAQQSKSFVSGGNICAAFSVCTDVRLGPLLPTLPETALVSRFLQIAKNDAGASGNSRRHRGNPQMAQGNTGALEAMGQLEVPADSAVVLCDFVSENMLAKCVHLAFYQHYGLRLSPDAIWLTIVQGLAKHIDKDPEGQRSNFVDFDGKKQIIVERPEFIKGSPDNDWMTVFPEFAKKIGKFIGEDKKDVLECNFSSSSQSDIICSHIALMDTVKHYFEYSVMCGCGIPSIELTGTREDWVKLRAKADLLKDFGLEWWTEDLLPVLDQFVAAASGSPDVKFWKSVCNLHGASGMWSGFVSGWVQCFFPYLNNGRQNSGISQWRKNYEEGQGDETERYNKGDLRCRGFQAPRPTAGYGTKLDMIPSGLSQAPVKYIDVPSRKSYSMTFNGGLVAVVQSKTTRTLMPVSGWAVLDHDAPASLVAAQLTAAQSAEGEGSGSRDSDSDSDSQSDGSDSDSD